MTGRLRPPRPGQALPLLGGLSPAEFVRRYWQKKPLLIRGAIPGFVPLLSRARLFALAAREQVESRLIVRSSGGDWSLEHGPFKRTAFPPLDRPGWTLLVQGVDLHDEAVHALLASFRFVPDARIDDVMISWASTGGGVGPHVDSYDVFLLQAQGRRRWRIGRQDDPRFEEDVPLQILHELVAEAEHVLEPGDMLYLPPSWAHDGAALDRECMTYSIGFRAPRRRGLALEVIQHLAECYEDESLYGDRATLAATEHAGRIPPSLRAFAQDAVRRLIGSPQVFARALGETLTEVKPGVEFDEPERTWKAAAVMLDRRTRMMYDEAHVFINGNSYRATGADAKLMRRLADERGLDARSVRRASAAAKALLREWFAAGWLRRY